MEFGNICKFFDLLEKLPFFIVTEYGIKVVNVPSLSFSVSLSIGVCAFQYDNNVYWFWYKIKSRCKRIEVFAPGINRRKYNIGSTLKLNKEIYINSSEDKCVPLFVKKKWNLKKLFNHGAMRIYFYPEFRTWKDLGISKFFIKNGILYGIQKSTDSIVELRRSEL